MTERRYFDAQIERLIEARAAYDVYNNRTTQDDLHIELSTIASAFRLHECRQSQALYIGDCFIKHFEDRLPLMLFEIASNNTVEASTIDSFVKILSKFAVTNAFTESPEEESVLATLMVYRAFLAEDGNQPIEKDYAQTFMYQWFGEQYPLNTLTSERAMVDILYGPGVWDLYCADDAGSGSIARILYKQQLAVRNPYKLAISVSKLNQVQVPMDMASPFE